MRLMSIVIYTTIYTTFASLQQTDQRNMNTKSPTTPQKHTSQQELPLICVSLQCFHGWPHLAQGQKTCEWQVSLTQPE